MDIGELHQTKMWRFADRHKSISRVWVGVQGGPSSEVSLRLDTDDPPPKYFRPGRWVASDSTGLIDEAESVVYSTHAIAHFDVPSTTTAKRGYGDA